MKRLERLINLISTKHRWMLHSVFWIVVLCWYVLFFGAQNSAYMQTLFFVTLVLPVTIGTTYFNNYFLIPRYLLRERYGLFVTYFIYTLIISVFLEMIMSIITFYLMAELKTSKMSHASFDSFFLLTSLLAVVFLGMTIKLLLHWKTTRDNFQKLMLEKVQQELKFLKAQLNPHFLFNTLNNLYYLTTQKSDLAPAAIMQLSEILDYSLYTSRDTFVSLEKEWQQVQNYIKLESLHYEDRLSIDSKIVVGNHDLKIAPMILITLVENAFKHSLQRTSGKGWISIYVRGHEGSITIVVKNSYNEVSARHNAPSQGIGLEILKNQLSILYPERYSLSVGGINGIFEVNLILAEL